MNCSTGPITVLELHHELLNLLLVEVVNILCMLVWNLQHHHPCLDECCNTSLSQQYSRMMLFHKSLQSKMVLVKKNVLKIISRPVSRDVSRPSKIHQRAYFLWMHILQRFHVDGFFTCDELLRDRLSLVWTGLPTPPWHCSVDTELICRVNDSQ